jgi:hypothetical protein
MTRSEALRRAPAALTHAELSRFRHLVKAKAWGEAAYFVLKQTGRADLSDAIWSGK